MVLSRQFLARSLVDRVVSSVLYDACPMSFRFSSRNRSGVSEVLVVESCLPFVVLLSFFLFDVADHSASVLLFVCCVHLWFVLVVSLELVRLRVACVVAAFHLSTKFSSVRFL